ncbi:MAG: flagellar export chaperone FliS [Herbaspirillum sp.]
MFGSSSNGANAYAKVGMETGVTAASPHQLIVMLFDGALVAVANAQQKMKSGDISGKGLSISKAIAIIDGGLRASLNKSAGGQIAVNLDALYEYMGRKLLAANIENEPAMLDEVHGLLADLKGAWEAIGKKPVVSDAAVDLPAAPRMTGYDALAPRMSQLVRA